MGAIKSNNYSLEEMQLSLSARALAHPARIKMVAALKQQDWRNIDFVKSLKLSKSTVKDHIDKLIEAGIVDIEYHPHFYAVSLKRKALTDLTDFTID